MLLGDLKSRRKEIVIQNVNDILQWSSTSEKQYSSLTVVLLYGMIIVTVIMYLHVMLIYAD